MKSKTDLVSIIIPCYNQANFIDETLQSVFNQTYENWECILVNDGSSDNTEDLIKTWLAKDKRFRYFSNTNSGVSVARNFGIENAKGNFIQFLDADDILLPTKLSESTKAFIEFDVQVVCTNYNRFVDNLNVLTEPFSELEKHDFTFSNIARYWNDNFTIPIHCFVFKREAIADFRFPVGLSAQEDWVMWLQIFESNPKTHYLPLPLALYRNNPFGRTSNGGVFDETLTAIHFLNAKLTPSSFRVLTESVIKRFNYGNSYWRSREVNLKKSNTYQFGLLCKKVLSKVGLLPFARSIFEYLNPLK